MRLTLSPSEWGVERSCGSERWQGPGETGEDYSATKTVLGFLTKLKSEHCKIEQSCWGVYFKSLKSEPHGGWSAVSPHSVQNNKNVEETKVRTDLISFLFCFQKAALGPRQTLEYFRFIARLKEKRSFHIPLCPHKCTAVPSVSTPHKNGTFVTTGEPGSRHHYPPRSMLVLGAVYSGSFNKQVKPCSISVLTMTI